MYKHFDVWKYEGNKAIRYRIFQSLEDDRYCIMGSDIFEYPLKFENVELFDRYFYESATDPEVVREREFFSDIQTAVAKFEKNFI